MRTLPVTVTILFLATFLSCSNERTEKAITSEVKEETYEKEPNDSADYKHIKYGFYLSKTGQLCERKVAAAKGTNCNCLFQVYYDSTFKIYTGDTIIEKSLSNLVDINSFVWLDSSNYSKDKSKVFYFHNNSDGGIRFVVDKADPKTFKRLCEYNWGIDNKHVFYMGIILSGLNLKTLKILFPPDTSDHIIRYVKDDKQVFYEDEIIKGADAKSFKVVSGKKWEAEDKNYKYEAGRRQK
jgi:hypothetical protein